MLELAPWTVNLAYWYFKLDTKPWKLNPDHHPLSKTRTCIIIPLSLYLSIVWFLWRNSLFFTRLKNCTRCACFPRFTCLSPFLFILVFLHYIFTIFLSHPFLLLCLFLPSSIYPFILLSFYPALPQSLVGPGGRSQSVEIVLLEIHPLKQLHLKTVQWIPRGTFRYRQS